MLALILALLACAPLPASPDAPRRELPCNGLDDDGDGVVDPDDLDGDGVGTCDVDRFDCDDLDPTIAPGRPELCNGLDDDCDGALPAREADDDRDGVPDCALDCDDADPVRQPLDADADGWTGCAGDCDDADPTVHPGAPEGCDGVDSDCDGLRGVNEQDVDGDGWSWCEGDCAPTDPWRAPADLDGDRFGGCDAVPDCDDADPRVGPAAEELCNGVDDDCDGRVDEEPEDPGVWYLDGDGDGFGADPLLACDPPPGASAEGGDCDDVDPSRHPFAPERCDGVDQDCDHIVDEQVPHATGWRDRDGDGFGDHAAPIVACQLPPDAATLDGDCDDEAPLTHPGARDLCNGVDDDCDGRVDEDGSDGARWYLDADGDGHGDPARSRTSCVRPAGATPDGDDCDDHDDGRHPGAPERCDGVDQDCDGEVDEDGVDGAGWFEDVDGDGFGGRATTSCGPAPGLVPLGGDCDDHATGTHPGVPERCDGIDEDCDGFVDEGVPGLAPWHPDLDGDGFGDAAALVLACAGPAHHVRDGSDCDDGRDAVHPGATELCNGLDDDCEGTVDVGAADAPAYWRDADHDGWGDAGPRYGCEAPPGTARRPGDCDDSVGRIHPDAPESCDHVDEDCDGLADEAEDVPRPPVWSRDADGDGYGDPGVQVHVCDPPASFIADASDCDDARDDVHPGAIERCDGQDEDCDGQVDDDAIDPLPWHPDADADGHGARSPTTWACQAPPGHVRDGDDCLDDDPESHPGATELCDLRDNDCDDEVDEGSPEARTWYRDVDRDGWGDESDTRDACAAPRGYVGRGGDCAPHDPRYNPDADELCTPLVDEDCDGDPTAGATDDASYLVDDDGDGFNGTVVRSCTMPANHTSADGDCDDADSSAWPGAPETCDDVDHDCDGDAHTAAGDAPPDALVCTTDVDSDGYGAIDGGQVASCTCDEGYAANDGDCDDSRPAVHPDALEVCNGEDDDCDEDIDEDQTFVDRWHDGDLDGYGAGDPISTCSPTPAQAAVGDDCDDGDASVFPGAEEVCDGGDDDCDGQSDEGLPRWDVWVDRDHDGWGAGAAWSVCEDVAGAVRQGGDCDDDADDIHPRATEACNAADDDCDHQVDEGLTTPTWPDADGDGWGDDDAAPEPTCPQAMTGRAAIAGDCDDHALAIHPEAEEACDDVDANCDGVVDDDLKVDAWLDLDRDGVGGTQARVCDDDPRIVLSEDDCRDTDASVFPGNPACERGTDNDCLGGVDHPCADVCGDGWCSPTELVASAPDCLEELPVELVDVCGFRLDTCATGADLTTSPAGPDVYVPRGQCVTLAGYDQVHQTCVDVLTPDGAPAPAWTICFPALDDPDPCAGDPACAAVDGCGPVYTLREVCP